MATEQRKREVVAGVDTHAETNHAAVITTTGQHVVDRQFPTTPAGYAQLAEFIAGQGVVLRAGVEGTSSYGAGLTGVLQAAGFEVVEVIRPARQERRRGKSDPIDAYNAARQALAGQHLPVPKTSGGDVDAIRVTLITRRSAVKARSEAMQQIKSILVTAPIDVREKFRGLDGTHLVDALAATRPKPATSSTKDAVLTGLRNLARRWLYLSEEAADAETDLDTIVKRVNPALRAAYGVGPITAAQLLVTAGQNPERITTQAKFASLAGVAPIPASSGNTTRWRLNRGGDRQANCAIHQIGLARISHDPRTQAYMAKLRSAGKTDREAMRCLKRAIAREVHALLTHPKPIPVTADLRPLRESKQISQNRAAEHFGMWAAELSRIERGLKRDDLFAKRYRDWLNSLPDPA
jgi:transposase